MTNAPVRYIVLHYSASYADLDLGVEDIRRMHLDRGFSDVGYRQRQHRHHPRDPADDPAQFARPARHDRVAPHAGPGL